MLTWTRLMVIGCLIGTISAVAAAAARVHAGPPGPAPGSGGVSEAEALRIGTEAYIYGYPLVTMEVTRRIMTNVPAADPVKSRAPMGEFVRAARFADAGFRDVTTPNADTLYSVAWLDLSKGPYILDMPEMGDRYYMMPMLSAWTDVFESPGTRTRGGDAASYAIIGPGWDGGAPDGVVEIKAPTSMVWIIGRTYSSGTREDLSEVKELMDAYRLTPLSRWRGGAAERDREPAAPVDPGVDMETPPRDQVNAMEADEFFGLLAELMKDNPPSEADAAMVAQLARVGIVPGEEFDLDAIDPAVARGLRAAPEAGLGRITDRIEKGGEEVNGWTTMKTGTYGTDYLLRAAVTYAGLGANLPEDAVYPKASVDSEGRPLSGEHRYVLRFPAGQLPPVKGFWSLTMYGDDYFFVDNPLDRFSLGSRDPLKTNPDGSLDLLIQHESPGRDREANWLPAPEGPFVLFLRLYWPEEAVLRGQWAPPAVRRAE